MSHFICPTCRTESDIFGKGGGEALAKDMNVPFLGAIPIYEPIRIGGDTGIPICVGEPKSPAAQAFRAAAQQLAVAARRSSSFKQGPKAIPLTQVRLTGCRSVCRQPRVLPRRMLLVVAGGGLGMTLWFSATAASPAISANSGSTPPRWHG